MVLPSITVFNSFLTKSKKPLSKSACNNDLGTNEIVNPETADNVRDPRDLLSDSRYGQ